MKISSIKGRTKIVAFLTVLALLLAGSITTLAWLERRTIVQNKTIISDFSISGNVYFAEADTPDNTMALVDILKERPYQQIDGSVMIPINLTDKTAPNYIGNLRLTARYEGSSPAYIRVRILEQWTEDDEFIESVFPSYNVPDNNQDIFLYEAPTWSIVPSYRSPNDDTQIGTGWYDNRKEDFYYYYNAPVYPHETASAVDMLLINGISEEAINRMGNLREGTNLQMMIQVEAVQPNRYREFFGIEKLPWE